MTLEHNDPDCPGGWAPGPAVVDRYPARWPQHWRCAGCAAIYYHAPDVMAAVEREHELGALMAALATEGG